MTPKILRQLFSRKSPVASALNRSVAMMDSLESRTLFTTTTVHVGPNEAIKSLDAVKWPTNSSGSLTVLLDYSSTPYATSHHAIFGNVTIESADSSHQATIQLPQTEYGTFYSNGKLLVKNIKTSGGIKGLLVGSNTKGSVEVDDVTMTDGGGIWSGQGCVSAVFHDNNIYGTPYDYVYSNFTGTAQSILIDNSNTSVPVPQGSRQAAIRFMDVNNLTIKNVVTKPHFNGGSVLKQDLQLRPSSKSMNVVGGKYYIIDIGDMTWRKPAQPIQSVTLTNVTMTKMPHITAGVNSVKLINCTVNGKKVTTTLR